jgi:2-oxoglutarate ferredoxin oxidoreductase subunit gamma
MTEEIIFAGFGGQGILLSGRIVCIAAMREGKAVSHLPSYGAEMRGGTANCSVVVSDGEVASPVIPKPTICVIMNTPSLLRFEPTLRANGLLIYNSSLIDMEPERNDIDCRRVEANDIADEEGSLKAANMVMLGALLKLKPELASFDSVVSALDEAVSSRNKALNAINLNALERGYRLFT